jgi:hypothetical protein
LQTSLPSADGDHEVVLNQSNPWLPQPMVQQYIATTHKDCQQPRLTNQSPSSTPYYVALYFLLHPSLSLCPSVETGGRTTECKLSYSNVMKCMLGYARLYRPC